MWTKKVIKKNKFIFSLYNLVNGFSVENIHLSRGDFCLLDGTKMKASGKNNYVNIGQGVRLKNCTFHISGNDNLIIIENNCSFCGAHFCIEDSRNTIHIGAGSTITNNVEIDAIEGTEINIGKDCMISSNIYIASGDSHLICDLEGNRINKSKDIKLGDHVWIGTRAIILKGSIIGSNSVVAAGAVCSNKEWVDNVVIAGNPAVIVKQNIEWKRERIKDIL